jgi:teichuronic acid exporter
MNTGADDSPQKGPPSKSKSQASGSLKSAWVAGQARRGVKYLLVRLVLVQGTQLGLGILIARTLRPDQFGALGLATALIGAFNLLADLGLGAAVIRRGEGEHSRGDLDSAFTIQFLVGVVIAGAILVGRKPLEHLIWEGCADPGWLGAIAAASLMVTPFRTGAITRLERGLHFGPIAVIETLEHLAYLIAMVALLLGDWTILALTAALLIRTSVGAILGIWLSGWRPRARFDLRLAKPLFAFGLPYQATGLLYVVNGFAVPALVGRVAGPTALGYVLWAGANAERVRPLLDNVARVAFPAFARLQEDPAAMRRGFERAVHGAMIAACAYGALLGGTAPLTVSFIFTRNWNPAIPLLYVLLATFPVVVATGFIDLLMFAKGRASMIRNIHALKLVFFAALMIPGVMALGPVGFGAAHAIASLGLLIALSWAARDSLPPRWLFGVAAGPILSGIAAAGIARASMYLLEPRLGPLWTISFACAAALTGMALMLLLTDRTRLKATVRAALQRES